MMWARVKGKTENDLLKMPFKAAYMFRPGYIHPMRNIKSKTKIFNTLYKVLKPLYFILKQIPNAVTNTTNVGKAMINAVAQGSEIKVLNNKEINLLADK